MLVLLENTLHPSFTCCGLATVKRKKIFTILNKSGFFFYKISHPNEFENQTNKVFSYNSNTIITLHTEGGLGGGGVQTCLRIFKILQVFMFLIGLSFKDQQIDSIVCFEFHFERHKWWVLTSKHEIMHMKCCHSKH